MSRAVGAGWDPILLRSPSRSPAYTLGVSLIALAYGFALASLPLEEFQDRSNYLTYAETSPLILLGYLQDGWLTVFMNEPLWLSINAALSFLIPPEITVRVLIFVSATTAAVVVLRVGPQHAIWLVVFLLLPNVVKNYVIHLRQGVAIAIFMVGWQSSSRFWRLAMFALAPLVHTSFLFVLLLLGLSDASRVLKLGADLRCFLFLIAGLGTSLMLVAVAQTLGARQVEYHEFSMDDSSGLGFVFWLFVFVLFLAQGKKFITQHSFAIGAIVFYLSAYFFVEVSARIFESALLVVLLAGLQLRSWNRRLYLAAILAYCVISWALRLNQPLLGFGIE